MPNAKINASQSSYCFGNNGVTLSAIDLGPKAAYEWFRDGVAQATTNIKRNTVYNATKGSWKLVIFSNGCLGVGDTFTVNETKLPDPIILNKSDSLKYFEGGKGVNLYLNQFPVGSTYFWYKDDKFQDSTKTNIYPFATKGAWSVKVNSQNCSVISKSNTFVAEINQQPIAKNDTTITAYLSPVSFNILSNDKDNDGSINTNTVNFNVKSKILQQTIYQKDTGLFVVDEVGKLTFTPDKNFTGTAILNYNVLDNTLNVSNTALVIIHTGPMLINDYKSVLNNNTSTIQILTNDISLNGINPTSIDLDPFTMGIQTRIVKNNIGTY